MIKDSIIFELKHVLDKAGITITAAAIQHLDVNPKYLYEVLGGRVPLSKKMKRRMEKLITTLKNSGLLAG